MECLKRGVPGDGGTGTGSFEESQALAALDRQRALTQDLMGRVAGLSHLGDSPGLFLVPQTPGAPIRALGFARMGSRGLNGPVSHHRGTGRHRAFPNAIPLGRVASSANLNQAYKRVKANKGSPGVDGMSVQDLRPWLVDHKDELVAQLVRGGYRPEPVKGVEIPKPGGGMRQLGIPTVIDRLVQQAILQVLQPILDASFSGSSFGFRPGRSAHDALFQAGKYVAEGHGVVVDLDLEKFFDRVNHDIPMARLARRLGDKGLLRIVRRFLEAGMMCAGVCVR